MLNNFFKQNRNALYGGAATALFVGLAALFLGNVSGYEAKQLIESSLPGINMLCNTMVLASATILALLLTLLGLSSATDSNIKEKYYQSVLTIAKMDTVLFVSALIMFQLFNIPITESDTLPVSWFSTIYWATLITSSILSGVMVTVILLLYTTVSNIISIVGLGSSQFVKAKEKEEDRK